RDFHVTGVQTCALPILDTEGKPATAVRKVQEAAQQDGARFFAGGILSSESLAMGKEIERLGGVFITTAGADEITGKDCNRATFQIGRASCRERVESSEE